MPRGAPDYSNVRAYGPLHRLDDQAELAARLGSPVVYDRRGNIVWCTDFSHGLQGSTIVPSDGEGDGYVTASRSFNGPFSICLDPSDEEGSQVYWNRIIHFIPIGALGAETIMSLDTDPYQYRLSLWYRDGAASQKGSIRYSPGNGNWEIQLGADDWVVILEDFYLQQGPNAWQPIKLVINANTGKYVRALIAHNVVLLSAYDLYETEDFSRGQLETRISVWGAPATHACGYVDTVIITQNEP